jgi:hypothetical protein
VCERDSLLAAERLLELIYPLGLPLLASLDHYYYLFTMVITTVESIRQSIGDGVRNISQLELELGETSDIPGLTAEIRKLQSAISLFIGSEDVEPQHMSELDWGSDEVIELFQALQTLRTGSCSGGISMMEEIHLQDLGISYGLMDHGFQLPC